MTNDAASYIPAINALISAFLASGITVALINFVLNRPMTKAGLDKIRADTEKVRLETEKLRHETEIRQNQTDDTLSQHQEQLDWTVSALSNIMAYMPGHFAHQALCQIRDKADEYYNDSNPHKKRLLLLLLDNGYLQPPPGKQEVVLSQDSNNKRLSEIAELTPMAKLMLQLREEVSKQARGQPVLE